MNKRVAITMILLLVVVVGYLGFDRFLKWHDEAVRVSVEEAREGWQERTEELEAEVADLKDELLLEKEATLPVEKLEEVFGEGADPAASGPEGQGCEDLERRLGDLFVYLQGREYLAGNAVGEDPPAACQRAFRRLSEHLPLVSGEMKDPYLMLKNVAHFYRVLGKQDVRIVSEILDNEAEIAESVGALLFEWFLSGDHCEAGMPAPPSLEFLYEYAGFFVNTLAGRGYLLRRDPRVRVLTTYYSVLILDRANEKVLNRHGIDIMPHVESTGEEISSQRSLVYRKQYLDTLKGLKGKYARR